MPLLECLLSCGLQACWCYLSYPRKLAAAEERSPADGAKDDILQRVWVRDNESGGKNLFLVFCINLSHLYNPQGEKSELLCQARQSWVLGGRQINFIVFFCNDQFPHKNPQMKCDYSPRIQFTVAESKRNKRRKIPQSAQRRPTHPRPPSLALSVWIFQQQMAAGETSNTFYFSLSFISTKLS